LPASWTMRTARSITSGEYRTDFFMVAPFSQMLEPPSNPGRFTFCLVGMPSFAPILSIDSQLARRFPMQFQLDSFTAGTSENPGNLIPFLNEIRHHAMQKLELTAFPRFDQTHQAHQMHAATGGSPAFVMSLIKEGILHALKAGSRTVTLEDFATAWEGGIAAHASLCRENPFRMSPGSLATALRGAL
ncbi:hypothetical protein, partial [Duganella radicis]|uniref:hypothetical protein n=1 Tax=Duganella radicis TaxID=551988 RepID=UPI001BAC930F